MADTSREDATAGDVQFFDVAAALQGGDGMHSRVDMAKSPNSYIAVFGVGPRAGETRVHSHPDSDQILFVMKGECTVEGLSGRYVLESDEGVLIPAGVNYGFTNMTQDELVFLSAGLLLDHLGLAPNLRKNIKLQYYEAGHMMYVRDEDLAKLKANVAAFIDSATKP